jgi:hypothetical protein
MSNVYVAFARLFTAHRVYVLSPLHFNDKSKLLSVAVERHDTCREQHPWPSDHHYAKHTNDDTRTFYERKILKHQLPASKGSCMNNYQHMNSSK